MCTNILIATSFVTTKQETTQKVTKHQTVTNLEKTWITETRDESIRE